MDTISNIMFAKEFFKIIDNDDTVRLNVKKFAEPLIALRLASESSFVEKVFKQLTLLSIIRKT